MIQYYRIGKNQSISSWKITTVFCKPQVMQGKYSFPRNLSFKQKFEFLNERFI